MSSKILKRYQEQAVEELLIKSDLHLRRNNEPATIIFKSPTGSGKTLMMTEYIERIIEEQEDIPMCFLWMSIGKGSLHTQTFESIQREVGYFPPIYLLEQEFFGGRDYIESNEVVVVNWEKLSAKDSKTGEWKNILMKDKETTNFRELIRNTHDSGTKIILIIDESHASASAMRALEIRDDIVKPDLTIEVSATPNLVEGLYQEKIEVAPTDVINEGMIKKELIINPDIDEIVDDEISSQELVLKAAFEKRRHLAEIYKQNGIFVNPLALIQLPPGEIGDDKKDFVEKFLAKNDITYENGKLAVWLSEEKVNNEADIVAPNDSTVEFLIFKQAIDTGWDCPRASVLIRFREIHNINFAIQTVGRILRMPEAHHYDDDTLNKGYIYTNVQAIEVSNDVESKNIIKSEVSKINEKVTKDTAVPSLRSYYCNRIDYGDLTYSFMETLSKTLCKYFDIPHAPAILDVEFNINQLRLKGVEVIEDKLQEDIILNKPLDAKIFDNLPKHEIRGREASLFNENTLLSVNLSSEDLEMAFNMLIKSNLNGFAPKRSLGIFKNRLYGWFHTYLNIRTYENGIIRTQNIVLNNAEIFGRIFDQATRAFKPVKEKELEEKIAKTENWNSEWKIPDSINFNPHKYREYKEYNLCLHSPCYLNIDSGVELDFLNMIDNLLDKIHWWWMNGDEHMASNFGIKYNKKSTFQPDFIISFKDGKIGLFDTKGSGFNEYDNKLKAEALQAYIAKENTNGKNLWGGIIIKEGEHFLINRKDEYCPYKDNPKDWEYLLDIL